MVDELTVNVKSLEIVPFKNGKFERKTIFRVFNKIKDK